MATDNRPELENSAAERGRRAENIFLLLVALALVGAGVWLVEAMIAARRADECLSAGRRNCVPLEVPLRER